MTKEKNKTKGKSTKNNSLAKKTKAVALATAVLATAGQNLTISMIPGSPVGLQRVYAATVAPSISAIANPGTAVNTTAITATPGSGNHLVIKVSSATIATPNVGDAIPTGTGVTNPYTSGANISGVDAVTNKYVAVYEATSTNTVVSFSLITLSTCNIAAPALTATVGVGTIGGTTEVTATPQAGDHLAVQVSATPLSIPGLLANAPTGANVTAPYISGTNISNVDAVNNKYLGVYELNGDNAIVSFTQISLTSANIATASGLAATATPGSTAGTTDISATPAKGDTLFVKVSSTSITAPAVGSSAPTGSGVTSNYISGSDLSGVDSAVNKYVGVYDVNSSGNVVSFTQLTLTDANISAAPTEAATASPGTVAGSTAITATPGTGNHLTVKVSSTSITAPIPGDAAPTGTGVTSPYTAGSNITGVDPVTNKYVGVYECNASNQVVKFSQITLNASTVCLPSLTATVAVGTVPGSTAITATPNTGDHLVVQTSSSPIAIPSTYSQAPTGAGVISPYSSGTNITGVDPVTNKYVVIYDVDATNRIISSNQFTLTASQIAPVSALTATTSVGSVPNTAAVTSTPASGDTLTIQVSSTSITTPYVGQAATTTGVTQNYVSGSNISGVDYTTNKYIGVYDVNSSGNVVAFTQLTMTAANISVAPTISATATKGSVQGSTDISATSGTGNHLVVLPSTTSIATPHVGDAVPTTTGVVNPYTAGADVTGVDTVNKKYLGVYEANASNQVVSFTQITLDKTMVNTPLLTATQAPGTVAGTTKVTATPNTGDTLTVMVSSSPVTEPNIGDAPPTGTGVTSSYVSGSNISGVDPITNKYLAVYDVNSSNQVVAFKVITLASADIAVASALTATVAQGSVPNTTAITATPANGDTLSIQISSTTITTPNLGTPAPTGTGVTQNYVSGSNISGIDYTTNKYIGVYDVNASGNVVAFKLITLVASNISPAPVTVTTNGQGTTAGTEEVTATPGSGNHLVIKVSSSTIASPNVGDAVPTGTGVTNPYTSGSDILGTDSVTNKYIGVYEANASNQVVSFNLITLGSSNVTAFSATASPGTLDGSTSVNASVGTGSTLTIKISNAAITAPTIGSAAPTTGVTQNYVSGANITGVDSSSYKYIGVYEVSSGGLVEGYSAITLALSNIAPINVTIAPGTVSGSTTITATPNTGNHFVTEVGSTMATPAYGSAAPTTGVTNPYTSGSNITGVDPVTNKYIGLFECNSSNQVVAFNLITLVPSNILAQSAPALTVTQAIGATQGSTKATATPLAGDHLVTMVSSSPIATPNLGDLVPTGTSVTNPYTSGADIPGVDSVNNKYVGVYDVTAGGIIAKFTLLTLTSTYVCVPTTYTQVSPGAESNTTQVATNPASGNHIEIKISSTAFTLPAIGSAGPTGAGVTSNYVSGSDIFGVDPTTNKYLGVYELNSSNQVVAFTPITITSANIATAYSLTATETLGTAAGTTAVTATPNTGNHLVIQITSTPITVPNVGSAVPTGTGVTNPYTSGSNITGVDSVTNKYIGVYEASSTNTVVKFTQLIANNNAILAPTLSVTQLKGATPNTTEVSGTPQAGDHYAVTVSSSPIAIPSVLSQFTASGNTVEPYVSGSDITGTDPIVNKYIGVYEINGNEQIIGFSCLTVTGSVLSSAPLLTTTVTAGTDPSTTTVTATPANGDTLTVKIASSAITTPNVGDLAPTGSNTIQNYVSGSEISGVDTYTNKYLGVYDVSPSGTVVAFNLITLTSGNLASAPVLNAISGQGTTAGTTEITATPGNGNHIAIQVASSVISTPSLGDAVPTSGTGVTNPYTSGANISGVDTIVNKYIGVYEANSSNRVVSFKLISVGSSNESTPALTATAAAGTTPNTTAITATPATGDTLSLVISSANIATPNIGDTAPSGSNVITSYASGTNVGGVDDNINKYVGVYDISSSGTVVAFKLLTLTSANISAPPTLSNLSVTPGVGQNATALTVTPNSGNTVTVQVISSSSITPRVGDTVPVGNGVLSNYVSGSDIPYVDPITNKYLAVYGVDSNGKVATFNLITLIASNINSGLTATLALGSQPNTTSLTATVPSGDIISLKISSTAIATPTLGTAAPTGTGVITNYQSGTNILGADPNVNKYIGVYTVDSNGNIVSYIPITVTSTVIQPVSNLAVTEKPGTAQGTIDISATPGTGNHLGYLISSTSIATPHLNDAPTLTNSSYTSGADISGTDSVTNKYVGVYELTSANKVVTFSQVTLGATNISVPTVSVTLAKGVTPSSTKVTATPASGDYLITAVSSNPFATPNVGDPVPTGSTVTNPYTSGSDVIGVDAYTNKYLAVYEVSSASNTITKFYTTTLTDTYINGVPIISAYQSPGVTAGSTKVAVTATGVDHFVVQVSSASIATPCLGDSLPTGTLINPYTSGNDITGVDPTTNKYVGVYGVDANNKILGFKLITLASTDISTVAGVSATANPGTVAGSTAITASAGTGNTLTIQVSATPITTPSIGAAPPTGTGVTANYTSGANITGVDAVTDSYVGVYSVNSSSKIVAFTQLTLTTANIMASVAPALTATVGHGAGGCATEVTATPASGDILAVQVSSAPIATPNLNATVPTGVGITNPYTSSSDITGVDPTNNKYLGVYDITSSGYIRAFKLITLTASNISPQSVAVTQSQGTVADSIALNVTPIASTTVTVKVSSTAIAYPVVGAAAPTGAGVTTNYVSGSNILGVDATTNKYIGVYCVDVNGNIVAFTQVIVGSSNLAPAPTLSSTVNPGTVVSSIAITATPSSVDHLVVQTSTAPITAPYTGGPAPTGTGVTNPYTSGSNITGVDPEYNKYVGVYEVNASNQVVKFSSITITNAMLLGMKQLNPVVTPGSTVGTLSLAVTPSSGDTIAVGFSNSSIATPSLGDVMPSYGTVMNPYTSGSSVSNVTLANDQYVGVYELNANGRIVGFGQITLIASNIGNVPASNITAQITATPGTTSLNGTIGTGNHVGVIVSSSIPASVYSVGTVVSASSFTNSNYALGSNLTGVDAYTNKYVQVYELDPNNKVVSYTLITLDTTTSLSVPTLNATLSASSTVAGRVQLNATPGTGNHLALYVTTAPITVPILGGSLPSVSNMVNPYTSGSPIVGADAVTNNYIEVFEVNSSNQIQSFNQLIVTSSMLTSVPTQTTTSTGITLDNNTQILINAQAAVAKAQSTNAQADITAALNAVRLIADPGQQAYYQHTLSVLMFNNTPQHVAVVDAPTLSSIQTFLNSCEKETVTAATLSSAYQYTYYRNGQSANAYMCFITYDGQTACYFLAKQGGSWILPVQGCGGNELELPYPNTISGAPLLYTDPNGILGGIDFEFTNGVILYGQLQFYDMFTGAAHCQLIYFKNGTGTPAGTNIAGSASLVGHSIVSYMSGVDQANGITDYIDLSVGSLSVLNTTSGPCTQSFPSSWGITYVPADSSHYIYTNGTNSYVTDLNYNVLKTLPYTFSSLNISAYPGYVVLDTSNHNNVHVISLADYSENTALEADYELVNYTEPADAALVSTAESTRKESDVVTAQTAVNALPSGSYQSYLQSRINAIVPIANTLTYTVAMGMNPGTTAITATAGSGNTLAIQVSSSAITVPNYGSPVPTGSSITYPYTSGADISGVDATTNKYVAVYSVNSSGNVVAFNLVTLTSSYIKAIPALAATFTTPVQATRGTTNGATKIFATPNSSTDHIAISVTSSPVSTPYSTVQPPSGVTNPYTSGTDITGVDSTVNKYVNVYELNSSNAIVAFSEVTLTASNIYTGTSQVPAASLNAAAVVGNSVGNTAISVTPNNTGDTIVVKVTSSMATVPMVGDLPPSGVITPYASGTDITGTDTATNKYVDVYELNSTGQVVAFKEITVVSADIKQAPNQAPTLSATIGAGSSVGTTEVSSDSVGMSSFAVNVSSTPSSTVYLGSAPPSSSTKSYALGSNISGVDTVNNKYVDVYGLDANGNILAFKEFVLTSGNINVGAVQAPALTVLASSGSVTGATALTTIPMNASDTFMVSVTSSNIATPNVGDAVTSSASAYTLGANITGVDTTTNKYVNLYEVNSSGKVVAFKEVTINATEIKQAPNQAPTLSATIGAGSSVGTTEVSSDSVGMTSFAVNVASKASSTVYLGSTPPSTSIKPYNLGSNISGIDAVTNKYVDVYGLDSNGDVLAFKEFVVTSGNINVGAVQAPTLPVLASAGTTVGTTALTALPVNSSDTFMVSVTSSAITTPNVGDTTTGSAIAYTLGSNISGVDATTNKYVNLYEVDSSGKIVAFKEIALTPSVIAAASNSATPAPLLNAMPVRGNSIGTTALTIVPNNSGDTIGVMVTSQLAYIPYVGDTPPSGIITPYVDGADINGVDSTTNKYINVYELNSSRKITAFKQVALTANDIKQAPTQAPTLNSVIEPGQGYNTTEVTATSAGVDHLAVRVSSVSAGTVNLSDSLPSGVINPYTSGSDITGADIYTNKYIDVYGLDANNNIVAFKEFTLTSNNISPEAPTTPPNLPAVLQPGSTGGNTSVVSVPDNGDHLAILISASQITEPTIGTDMTNYPNLTNNYVSGSNISGAVTGDYIGVYELDGSNKVVSFSQFTVTASELTPPTNTVTQDPSLAVVSGFLQTASGAPLANVPVTLHSTPETVMTDSNGYFVFNNVPYATHTLSVPDTVVSQYDNIKMAIGTTNGTSSTTGTGTVTFNLPSGNATVSALLSTPVNTTVQAHAISAVAVAGSQVGTTAVAVVPMFSNDTIAVAVGSSVVSTPNEGDSLPSDVINNYQSMANITGVDATTNKYISVYEVDNTGKIDGFTQITLSPSQIATASTNSGSSSSGSGSTQTSSTRLVVMTSSSMIPTPTVGSPVPTGANVTDPYIVGQPINGVTNANFMGMYQVDSNNKVLSFSLIPLSININLSVAPGKQINSTSATMTTVHGNTLTAQVLTSPSNAVASGSLAPTGTNVVSNYVSGSDITGVDPTTNKYLAMYEVSSDGYVVASKVVTLSAGNINTSNNTGGSTGNNTGGGTGSNTGGNTGNNTGDGSGTGTGNNTGASGTGSGSGNTDSGSNNSGNTNSGSGNNNSGSGNNNSGNGSDTGSKTNTNTGTATQQGTVTIRYINSATGSNILQPVNNAVDLNTSFTADAVNISGYSLVSGCSAIQTATPTTQVPDVTITFSYTQAFAYGGGGGGGYAPSSPSTGDSSSSSNTTTNGNSTDTNTTTPSTSSAGITRVYDSSASSSTLTIAKDVVDDSTQAIVITSDASYADGLSGSALAAKYDAPIIEMHADGNNDDIYQYLSTISPDMQIFILGQTGVISADAETKIKTMFHKVTRLGGADRFETSLKINEYMGFAKGTPVFVASGENFADALSVGAISGVKQMPVLLVQKDSIPDSTLEELKELKPSEVFIAGGTGVVSSAVENMIDQITSTTVIRLGGVDRYRTSLLVAGQFETNTNEDVYVTGKDFKDALSSEALAAKNKADLILIDNDDYADQARDSRQKGFVVGSVDTISDDVMNDLENGNVNSTPSTNPTGAIINKKSIISKIASLFKKNI